MANVDKCIEQLMRCEPLSEAAVKDICARVSDILLEESNVREIQAPVTVVGDVHGQLYDLFEIFRIAGEPPNTNYLFLGDYVDRGHFNVETISLLACLKLRYPDRITLLRGNHESRAITKVYGFYVECIAKYGSSNVWNYFCDMFDYLNLAAVISAKIYCVHGGLSPCILSVDQARLLDRFREPPSEGAFADMLWSDPTNDQPGFAQSQRNAGYLFGAEVVQRFLEYNSLDHVLRAHQLCMMGYDVLFGGTLSTVWSAPNYCYRCGNLASVLEVDDSLGRRFNLFAAAPEDEKKLPAELNSELAQYFT